MKPFIITFTFLILLSQVKLSAQCGFDAINLARELYDIGKFDQARSGLESCLNVGGFITSDIKNKALRLLSLIAIAEDDVSLAESYVLQIVKNNPNFKDDPHLVFDEIFKKLARENQVITVSSVSKRAEDIRTAPANVILIDREEILSRGYMDLIELLADQPGFSISKTFSATYANAFQLGFRQENTERTLFMIDGVEENDIWSNIAYISRQYPLSNVKAVEIIYGPSSTIYGPRAFVGAINVITYPAGQRPDNSFSKNEINEKSGFYGLGSVSAGSYHTRDADLTIGLKSETVNFSLTGRYFYSDENDLSFVDFYDYNPNDINTFKYDHLRLNNSFRLRGGQQITAEQYLDSFQIPANSPYLQVFRNSLGTIDSILLSPEGVERARSIDRTLYTGNVNGVPNGYSNHSRDYFYSGKMSFSFFEFGFRSWRREEGFNYYQDISTPGSKNGNVWVPKNTTVYSKFERAFENFTFSNLLSFHQHALDNATNRVNFRPLGFQGSGFHLAHLINPDSLQFNILGTTLVKPGFSNLYFYYGGQQIRNDMRFFYDNKKLSLIGGAEFRSSQMQGDYLTYQDYEFESKPDLSKAYAQELGTVPNQLQGSNIFSILDLSAYVQGTYSFIPDKFFVTAGGRFDYNRIRASGGFGTDFTPRIVVIYKFGEIYARLILSEGIQNVSQWTKYSTGGNRIPNPTLDTEKVKFANFSLEGSMLNKSLQWSIMSYFCDVSDVVASQSLNGILMNRNVGEYRIFGTMASLAFISSNKNFRAEANYTFMNPQDLDRINSDEPLRIGDIPAHQFNLNASYRLISNGGFLGVAAIRTNYVGKRPVGPETSQKDNPGLMGSGFYPQYFVVNGSVTLSHKELNGLSLQVTVNNILDQLHYHPGPRTAAANYTNRVNDFVNYVPQRGRHLFVRAIYRF
jgi:outer membrane receptor for ferrienterochelin and colicins